jgi:hypothetical protein
MPARFDKDDRAPGFGDGDGRDDTGRCSSVNANVDGHELENQNDETRMTSQIALLKSSSPQRGDGL